MRIMWFCGILLWGMGLYAQDTLILHQKEIMRDAREMAEAMEEKDWEEVLKRTYAPLVQKVGGERALIQQAKLSEQALKQQGFDIDKAELSEPIQEIKYQELWLSIIPIRLTFDGPLGKLYSESALMGISANDGQNWQFISLTQVDMNQLLEMFPRLEETLVFPRRRVYQD